MGDSKNCTILVIAALIIIGGMVMIGVYFATYVEPDDGSATTVPSSIDPTTNNPEITDPESTDPVTTEAGTTESTTNESESTTTNDPGITDPESTDPVTTEAGTTESTTNESESTTTIEPTDPSTTLLFASTTDGRILMLDPSLQNYTTVVEEENHLGNSFDYYRKDNLFLYATTESNEPVKLSSDEYEYSMNSSARWTKTAMAVDYISEKVYLLDGLAEKLYVMDVKNDGYAVVSADLVKPKDILVDSERSLMFILQESSILSLHSDGRGMLKIAKEDNVRAFTIDRKNVKVYYADDDQINEIDYLNKTAPKSAFKIESLILSMAVYDDQLMFISTTKNDTEKSLNYCLLSEKCASTHKVKINDGQSSLLSQIKSYDFVENDFVNPCQEGNGGCEQLCISSVNDKNYTCKCNAGWQLDDDSKSCSLVKHYMMYIHNNKVKGRTLDKVENSFVDMDLDFEILNSENNQVVNFDYDSHSNIFVYAIGSNVYYKNLTDKTEWMIKDDSQCDIIPVVDWVSKNLYNLKNCPKNSYLTVRNLHGNSKDEKKLLEYKGNIKSFVVVPDQARILFTYHDLLDDRTRVHFVHLNGKEWTKLAYEAYEMGLTVDYDEKLIYYMFSVPMESFGLHFDLNNINNIVVTKQVKKPKWISAFRGYLYVANANEIWRVKTRVNQTEIQPTELMMQVKKNDIQGFRIYSKELQPIDVEQPCAFDNNHCQRYCFAVMPTKGDQLESRCDCNDNEVLGEDKRTCSERKIPQTVLLY